MDLAEHSVAISTGFFVYRLGQRPSLPGRYQTWPDIFWANRSNYTDQYRNYSFYRVELSLGGHTFFNSSKLFLLGPSKCVSQQISLKQSKVTQQRRCRQPADVNRKPPCWPLWQMLITLIRQPKVGQRSVYVGEGRAGAQHEVSWEDHSCPFHNSTLGPASLVGGGPEEACISSAFGQRQTLSLIF